MSNELLYLPVSLGEAIDKLTILDIKMDKIKDSRRNDVRKEYYHLRKKLEKFIIKYENLYKTMKKVNLLIWDMMDSLRDGNLDAQSYLTVCKECIEYNDIRFRVKNKINCVSMSALKEQKSYKINRLLIEMNADVKEKTEITQIIKYFSFMYDEINIVGNGIDIDYLKIYFDYDNTILFIGEETCSREYVKKYVIDQAKDKLELYKLFDVSVAEINKLI
jgi:hypothetical protein